MNLEVRVSELESAFVHLAFGLSIHAQTLIERHPEAAGEIREILSENGGSLMHTTLGALQRRCNISIWEILLATVKSGQLEPSYRSRKEVEDATGNP